MPAQTPAAARKSLDIEAALRSFTSKGLAQAYWPCNRLETGRLRDDLLARLHRLHDEQFAESEFRQLSLRIMAPFWLQSMLRGGYSLYLADTFRDQDVEVACGPRYQTLAALLSGVEPPYDRLLARLVSGPPRVPAWRRPLRLVRQIWSSRSLRPRIFSDPKQVIAIAHGGLIDVHAAQIGVSPIYCDPQSWFSRVQEQPQQPHLADAAIIADEGIAALADFGIKNPERLRKWIRRQAATSFHCIQVHHERLRRSHQIPKRLWMGTTTSFWPRLLAAEVLRRGGTVYAHDHGIGNGLVELVGRSIALQGFCSHYASYDDVSAEVTRRSFETSGLAPGLVPEIVVLPAEAFVRGTNPSTGQIAARHGLSKTVMVLPLSLAGETTNLLNPQPDDIPMQDLNCRLLSCLLEQRVRIRIKPHPEFDHSAMSGFQDRFGAEIVEGRFEDTAAGIGAVIFTHPLSTTFRWALDRNMPMILIDFGFASWRPQIVARLRARVSVVEGGVDKHGRLDFDQRALKHALESLGIIAPAKTAAPQQREVV